MAYEQPRPRAQTATEAKGKGQPLDDQFQTNPRRTLASNVPSMRMDIQTVLVFVIVSILAVFVALHQTPRAETVTIELH